VVYKNKTKKQFINKIKILQGRIAKLKNSLLLQKNIEKILRVKEERYRYIFEKSHIGICILSLGGRVITANKAMQSITGYSLEELKKIKLAGTYENKKDRKMLLKALRRYGSVVDYYVRLKRKEGISYDALLSISRFKIGGKEFFHTICQDITERKKIEKMKDNLLRDVSHTLKTPIAMIEMAYDMSEKGIRGQDTERLRKSQDIIVNNIIRLRQEIDNILNLFTLKEGKLPKRKESVSLKQIIYEIIRSLRFIVDRKGLEVKIHIPQDADKVFINGREMGILMNNVIDNAIKFTERGGISITTSSQGEFVKIKVVDTGCGIATKEKAKLFNAFYKGDAALPGVGLGLPICQTIVNRNKGTIKIISKGIGKGTTVIVKLPKGE